MPAGERREHIIGMCQRKAEVKKARLPDKRTQPVLPIGGGFGQGGYVKDTPIGWSRGVGKHKRPRIY